MKQAQLGKRTLILVGSGAALLAGVMFLSVFCFANRSHQGAASKEELVQRYLVALQKKSSRDLETLLPKGYNADQEIQDKLNATRQISLTRTHVTYSAAPTPDGPIWVTIRDDSDAQWHDDVFIKQINDRWYVIIGHVRDHSAAEAPSTKP